MDRPLTVRPAMGGHGIFTGEVLLAVLPTNAAAWREIERMVNEPSGRREAKQEAVIEQRLREA